MQDNFNIHNWKLDKAVEALDENTFTSKYNDDPKLKGGQKDLPDALQAKIVAKEGEDHEVSMAQNSLKATISAASELMSKLGDNERNIPGWIQDHITNAENYIEQANQGFHELEVSDNNINTDVMNKLDEADMFVTGGNINPELRQKVERFVKGVAKYYDYSVDDAYLSIMTILKGGLRK